MGGGGLGSDFDPPSSVSQPARPLPPLPLGSLGSRFPVAGSDRLCYRNRSGSLVPGSLVQSFPVRGLPAPGRWSLVRGSGRADSASCAGSTGGKDGPAARLLTARVKRVTLVTQAYCPYGFTTTSRTGSDLPRSRSEGSRSLVAGFLVSWSEVSRSLVQSFPAPWFPYATNDIGAIEIPGAIPLLRRLCSAGFLFCYSWGCRLWCSIE
jgi:hypothetical protein